MEIVWLAFLVNLDIDLHNIELQFPCRIFP